MAAPKAPAPGKPRLHTTRPATSTSSQLFPEGYTEVGTVDVNPGPYGINTFRNLNSFRRHIRADVCELGGDAAIAWANGRGVYIKATVIRRLPQVPSSNSPGPSVPTSSNPPPPPRESSGAPIWSSRQGEIDIAQRLPHSNDGLYRRG